MPTKYQPTSFHLQWHITERCNLACKHCYFDEKFFKNELSLDKLFRILNDYFRLIKKWKIPRRASRISITGGEPMVRKDFFEFLKKCYQNRELTRYGILTNGILLDREKVLKLKELEVDYAQVSLEGVGKTNDEIRGKGTFEKIIEAVKLLVKNKIFTGISVTMTKQNLEDVPLLIGLAENLKVNSLGLRGFIPVGRGRKMKKLMLSPLETKELYIYILRTKQKLRNQRSKLMLGIGCEDGILAQEGHYLPNACSAAYGSLTILPNGDVYPCRRLPIYVGNVLENSLEDIYYNSKRLQELRNINNINKKCQNCFYFRECLGGAKCASFSYFGSPFAPDPKCWRLFKKLPKKEFRKYKINPKVKLNKKLIKSYETS